MGGNISKEVGHSDEDYAMEMSTSSFILRLMWVGTMIGGILYMIFLMGRGVYMHYTDEPSWKTVTPLYQTYEERANFTLLKRGLVAAKLGFPTEVVKYEDSIDYGDTFYTPSGMYTVDFNIQEDVAEIVSLEKVEDFNNKE